MRIDFDPISHRLIISQTVVFENAQDLLSRWQGIAESITEPFLIDCQGLEHGDSSFLAFLIEVKRECVRKNLTVSILGMPRYLHGCIRTYGLEDLFPLEAETFSSDSL